MTLFQMISGFWLACAIYVAAELGLADRVEDQPRTATELAVATGTHAPSLYRILRALANAGVFAEDEDGRFALTPLGASLRSNVPGSLRAFARLHLGGEHYLAWGDLLYSVKTGENAFHHAFGVPLWQYYAQHPENAGTFDEAMATLTEITRNAVLTSYDFSSSGKIVDIGGGRGSLIASILKAYPDMRGVLFDMPRVIAWARHRFAEEGVVDRCDFVAGDFFESVPSGGDTYILKWIIHDWDAEHAIAILKNCHRAMAENGKLLLVETIIPHAGESHISKLLDLNMMVIAGGRERTGDEYEVLLKAAGFRLSRIIPTPSSMSVIEAVR
jgi:ubiquinone/menaquinone biosynthesis C-methylase UbiE